MINICKLEEKLTGFKGFILYANANMAIDTKPLIARISESESLMDEMIETYEEMDYEDFDTFCYHYDLPFADYDVEMGFEQLHAFMLELREIRGLDYS